MAEAAIHILLIEDNLGDVELIREALDEARATNPTAPPLSMVTADQLAAGLTLLDDEGVHVVLLDLDLPDSQGLDTFLRVQARATTRPIIVLSRPEDETVATRAIREGAQDYVSKASLDGDRLLRSLRYALERKRGEIDRARLTQERGDRARAEALTEQFRRREELFRVAQEVSPVGFSYHRIVRDAGGDVIDLEYVYQNAAAARINQLPSGDAVNGTRMLATFPQLRETALWAHYHRVAASGESWRDEVYYGGEHFDAWFCITAVRPTADTLSLTFEDVTARKRVERAQEEARQRVIDVLESMGDAFLALDADWRITLVNRQQEKISQTRREDTLGKNFWEVFPAAADPTSKYWTEYHRCVAEQVPVHFEDYYPPLDVWTAVSAYPAPGGGLSVFFRDINARKRLEAERERLLVVSKTGEEQFRTLADAIPVLAWYAEPDGHIPWYNRRWFEYTGTSLAEQEGWKWQSVHDPADVDRVTAKWKHSLATGDPFEDVFRLRGRDGGFRWFLTRVQPLRDAEGRIVRWFGTNVDIDQQKRAEASSAFLARASAVLGSSLDVTATLQQLAALAVPERADWCSVYLLDDERVTLAAVSHVDPAKEDVLREIHRRYPTELHDVGGPGKVLRTGQTEVLAGLTDAARQAVARDATHLDLMRELPVSSVIMTPLVLQGRTLGSISLAVADAHRRFERTDVGWVEELARRVAIALDNARLFEMAQQERTRAEEANRAKDLFLSILSHELRTPLNAVLGWTRLLKEGRLPEEKRDRALDTIDRNARNQVALIEDILDVSRITSGKLRLAVAPVELIQVVEAALDTLRPAAEAKGVRLQAVLDPDAGSLHGDATRLQQVVWNLVSNAVKFTPKGGRVYVRLERESSHVQVVVADTGQGIDPAFLPHIFEAFRQQDASSTRQHGGLGLGLAIVKHLVELHGGTIRAESEGPGQGSNFTVRLPVAPIRISPAPPVGMAVMVRAGVELECPAELEGLRILMCDDEQDARDLIRFVLEHCKATVTPVASAAEALEALRNGSFDVLVSDIGMPGEDGYSLIKKVRALPAAQGGRVPAVALTAYAGMSDRTRALMAGYHAHAVKPIEPQELLVVIANLVGRFSKA